MVWGPGGYKFLDYTKFGVPLQVFYFIYFILFFFLLLGRVWGEKNKELKKRRTINNQSFYLSFLTSFPFSLQIILAFVCSGMIFVIYVDGQEDTNIIGDSESDF